ncbi:FAD-dependent oxidoreductase [Mahella australiensis]|uniref:Fumarate reductase/succinate dehydrogenase flavoprotein domain protein n=1 Tax=Mahella australiensis (strain DSM 15567 / CIP 107919 / 50-1 BON) TaxID=697281 RepID=F4A125_MAHA5|nr:FAD-dependent oxidoreductase [Mahella australiensis]AEE95928.1 fumarate reductase/succinate dehydrogenase flavoprotein domain protein [Mahella australiensis 50-1 BON]
MRAKTTIERQYDIVIVGGGMSGICAAIAAARHGSKTAIIQNRPVFGGNASSEIRMHICGADVHGSRSDARETGILEEILLENRRVNPQMSFSVFDTVMWEKVKFQDNLDMYLNTHMTQVETTDNKIVKIIAEQITTEKIFEFKAKIFVDATGDATLAYLAGAEYMFGREGKAVFGEKDAPDESDDVTMGSSLLFKAVDAGHPVPFIKPSWANSYTDDDLAYRGHNEITSGYWWIELGGDDTDVIADGEVIRDELLKAVYGIWDHIKNSGHHNADNFVLDWVGFLPGKRESRRVVGDYVLKEQDCLAGKIFDDAVAYGGWPMDMHVSGGIRTRLEPNLNIQCDEMYTIPYRCLYSKNISNLIVGGRAISASHMAFGSTRVMATCAVVGQAIGTAGAMAVEKGVMPRDVNEYIKELQQELLKDDCYIPGFKNEDAADLAKKAKVTCSSFVEGSDGQNVISGVTRRVKENTNCWISSEMGDTPEWIDLAFDCKVKVKEIHFKFDSNLSKELMPSLSHSVLSRQIPGIPAELVKDYTIEFYSDGKLVQSLAEKENYLRLRVYKLPAPVECDDIKVVINATNGDKHARIFEVRVY